ncbi:MAG: hypothetical protein EBT02_18765 [Planctomycetia bacterium]|nr:hypothetical protein [Planctomycetia bacterium]
MLGADGFKATFVFFLSSFFSLFFLHHPTLFRWKRALRFASPGSALAPRFRYPVPELVEGSNLHRALVILVYTGIHAWFSFRVFPCPSVANASAFFFFFLFIDAGVFEDRAVAMGKPHCNRSICTFRLWNMRFCHPRECGEMNAALKPRRGEIR